MDSLSLDTITLLDSARTALDLEIEAIRAFMQEKPEAWFDSEEGSSYKTWVAALEYLSQELTDVPDSPEQV